MIQRIFIILALTQIMRTDASQTTKMVQRRNIYFGIGLWSKQHGLTTGLPIDIVPMIIAAERVRQQSNSGITIILLADHLALQAGADEKEMQAMVKQYKAILTELMRKLDIKNNRIVLSSELALQPLYKEIEKELINKKLTGYELGQTAISRYLQLHEQVGTKISWKHSNKQQNNFDEQHFDIIYHTMFGNELSCVYVQAGRACQRDNGGSRVPYHARKGDVRLLFGHHVDTISTMSRSARAHAKNIIALLLKFGVKNLQSIRPNDNNYDHLYADLNRITNLKLSCVQSTIREATLALSLKKAEQLA